MWHIHRLLLRNNMSEQRIQQTLKRASSAESPIWRCACCSHKREAVVYHLLWIKANLISPIFAFSDESSAIVKSWLLHVVAFFVFDLLHNLQKFCHCTQTLLILSLNEQVNVGDICPMAMVQTGCEINLLEYLVLKNLIYLYLFILICLLGCKRL